jgi:hypothetical protein
MSCEVKQLEAATKQQKLISDCEHCTHVLTEKYCRKVKDTVHQSRVFIHLIFPGFIQ